MCSPAGSGAQGASVIAGVGCHKEPPALGTCGRCCITPLPLEQAAPRTHVSTGKLPAMLHCHPGLSCPKLSCGRVSCAELALMVLVSGGTILCWAKLGCMVLNGARPS